MQDGSRFASNQIQACIPSSPAAWMGCGTCYGQTVVMIMVPLPDKKRILGRVWCSADRIAWRVMQVTPSGQELTYSKTCS